MSVKKTQDQNTSGAISGFVGFEIPEQNWFKLPNNWTDITASMHSWAEHKVVEYVLRHTWGYQEYGQLKRITLDEFEHGRKKKDDDRIDNGVGLRRQAIISGLKLAVEDGFLEVEVDDRDKGRVKKFYGLRMLGNKQGYDNHTSPLRTGGYDNHTPANVQGYDYHTPDVCCSHRDGMNNTHRTEKETIERNLREKEIHSPQNGLWSNVLKTCQSQMTQATYDAHLANSQLVSLDDTKAVIGVPTEMSREWMAQRLHNVIEQSLVNYLENQSLKVEFIVLQ